MISTSKPGTCTFGGRRAARPAFTRSEAENYAPCGGKSVRRPQAPACLFPNVWRLSALPAISAWSCGLARPRASASSFTATCCGILLANDGQDTRAIQHYLGHKSITSTVRYTALEPDRFKGFWKD